MTLGETVNRFILNEGHLEWLGNYSVNVPVSLFDFTRWYLNSINSMLEWDIYYGGLLMNLNKTRQLSDRSIQFYVVVVSLLFLCFLVSGCSTNSPIVPAVTLEPTGERFVGKFIWYDLFVIDLEEVVPFYEDLFGWSFVDTEAKKDTVKTIYRNGVPIGNAVEMVRERKGKKTSNWLGYLSTNDVDAACLSVEGNKGSIHMEPKDLPHRGRVAVMRDPQGAYAALVASTHGDPPDSDEIENSWVGSELWTTSISGALEFYTALFDYDVEMRPMSEGFVYTELTKKSVERAAIVKIPWEDEVKPIWVPYVAVKDIMGVIEKAHSLGGTILINAAPVKQENPSAIIADPQGAVFGVVAIGEEQPL